MEALISVATIYLFILIGFFLKLIFKEEIHERTFVLLNLYFLQPVLIFWGLTRSPLSSNIISFPAIYFLIIFITLFLALMYAKFFIKNKQDKSIFLASSLVGNTGNLGIPLGIALFGIASVPYTSILNIANIFYIYIFSVFFFAGEKFSLKSSLFNILKIPAIWFTIFALFYNFVGFSLNENFDKVFTMGAYSAIVLQLIVFGIFMSQVKIKTANWKLSFDTIFFKHLLLPLIGLIVILAFNLSPFLAAILFLELIVPLAVNNVNIASLYNCKVIDVTFCVLSSNIIFTTLIFFYLLLIKYFFGF